MAAALCWTPPFRAHEHNACVELNNSSNNRLGIFELLGATGDLKRVQEVTTGGRGANGGYISIPQIVSTSPSAGRACVFAVNSETHNITPFQVTIEHEPDTPCPCANKAVSAPVSIGVGAQFGPLGGGVAVTPDGLAVYSANPGSSDISTFDVRPGCAMALATGPRLPAPTAPADIQVHAEGRCLAVSSPVTDRIGMYRIGTNRRLAPVAQFPVPGPGRSSGIEFSSRLANDVLYVTKTAPGQAVIVRFLVDTSTCRLASPQVTTLATGRSSSVAKLDPENRCLFVPNHNSGLAVSHPPSTLSSFAVEPATGRLSPVTTVDDVAFFPAGMGFGQTFGGQRYLYYTSFTRQVFRRPVNGCLPGPVVTPGVAASTATFLPATGPLRTLTIIQ